MNKFTRESLKDYPELLKKFEMSEARFLLDTDGEYETIEIELSVPEEKLEKFVACLAKYDLSFDAWACFMLTNEIIKLEMQDEDFFDDFDELSEDFLSNDLDDE